MFICTHVQPYFQLKTLMNSQVVIDIATNNAAVVDPVLDDNFKSGDCYTKAADALHAHVRYKTLQSNVFLRCTPMHHTSGACYQQERSGGETVIRKVFKKRKTHARDAGAPNAHPAINSGECPRGGANSGRRKRSRQLAYPTQHLANSEVA